MAFAVSVALHIGAHKTATTHIQQAFIENDELLQRSDATVLGPNFLRKPGHAIEELFGLMGHPEPAGGGYQKALDLAGDKSRLLLSEENFIGSFRHPRGDVKFPLYPDAEDRIAEMVAAVAPAPLDVFLAVRDPADWLVSCYSQVLIGDVFVHPSEYFAANAPSQVDWVDLVRRIRAVPGLRTFGVWPYENYPRNAHFVMRQMLRRRAGALVWPPREVSNMGLSARAIQATLENCTPGAAVAARQAFPAGPEFPKFGLVDDDLRAEADALYRGQLEQIAAVPGVQFLG